MTTGLLKFTPWLRTMVWGGEKIASFKGVRAESDKVGESWEISGVEGHLSEVAEGPLRGRNLRDIVHEYKGGLVGNHVYAEYGDEFPLLIKFIDAKSDLSIQVHPDDEMAVRKYGPGSKGKTEMWYVVAADPGAHLLSGLAREITPEEYVERVGNDSITEVLCKWDVHQGDVFFLPAGRIHAIGPGCFIAEIQQTSDYTYRIYDYGRLGLDGKPRELHTELAKEAIDYQVYDNYKTDYSPVPDKEVELVSCPYFTTSLYDLDKPFTMDLSKLDSFLALICIEGSGTLSIDGMDGCSVSQGETVLVPASAMVLGITPSLSLKLLGTHC